MSADTDMVERVAPIVARALAKRAGLADHRPADAWLNEATVATRSTLDASGIGEMVEAAKAAGSALDNWIRIVDLRAPLNPDLKHYFWKRDPTWDEVQEAMRANNELAAALSRATQSGEG